MDTQTTDKIETACIKYKAVKDSKIKKFSKLDEWLDKESSIFLNETKTNQQTKKYPKFKRGEIIKVDFGINIGSELSHTHYAIILNSDDTNNNDNISVMPITSKNGYKRIPLGKILLKAIPETQRYNLECFGFLTQIKTISKKRIYKDKFTYICDCQILDKIDIGIKNFLTKHE